MDRVPKPPPDGMWTEEQSRATLEKLLASSARTKAHADEVERTGVDLTARTEDNDWIREARQKKA